MPRPSRTSTSSSYRGSPWAGCSRSTARWSSPPTGPGCFCCQDPAAARQAILCGLHGLPGVEVDEATYRSGVEYWEDKPFVRFLREVNGASSDFPFVPDRLARLEEWADSGSFREILGRAPRAGPDPDQFVTIRSVVVRNVADAAADPYLVAYSGERKLFTTPHAEGLTSARWTGIDRRYAVADGQPLFFEVWNADWGRDAFLGGFVVYPRGATAGPGAAKAVFTAPLEWDWKARTQTARQGYAEVTLKFSSRPQGDRK